MNRVRLLFTGLLFLACLAAAGQMVQSQQNTTVTVTSLVTSNELSTTAVATQVVTTTSGQIIPVYSGTVPIPGTHGVCGVYFVQPFNGTTGEVIAGSVEANSSVDVYVMTAIGYQSWSHQVVAGGDCTPPAPVVSQENTMSYSFATALPATGLYDLVVNNLSRRGVTATITAVLTSTPPSVVTATEYSTVNQQMIQTIMETSVQTVQSTSQPTSGGSNTATLVVSAVVIVVVAVVVVYLAKSKRGKAGSK